MSAVDPRHLALMNEPVTLVFLGKPVPARQKHTTKSGFKFVPLRQQEAVAAIRAAAQLEMVGREMLSGPLSLSLIAEVPIPVSKSKKWKTAAVAGLEWPTTRPDLKNLLWLVEDALTGVVYADDSLICQYPQVEKRYGLRPRVVVTIAPIDQIAATVRRMDISHRAD